MEYIIDKNDKYTEEILTHLRAHNNEHTGERKNYGYSFYLVEDEQLQAGMKTHLSWDWVSIKELKYNSISDLKKLINEVCRVYHNDAVGISFNSNFKHIADNLVEAGFTLKGKIKYSPMMSDFFNLELTKIDSFSNDIEGVIHTKEVVESFDRILNEETKRLKKKYNVKDSQEKVAVIALDKDVFAGGVLGEIYDDHVYVDLLVVRKEYRNKYIGTHLMKRLEEELNGNIKTISLGTTQFQAKNFYEKQGYKTIRTQKNFPKGFECYTLVKEL